MTPRATAAGGGSGCAKALGMLGVKAGPDVAGNSAEAPAPKEPHRVSRNTPMAVSGLYAGSAPAVHPNSGREPFGIPSYRVDACFLRWGLKDVARRYALRHWLGSSREDELIIVKIIAQQRCERAGYLCDAAQIATEEFDAALDAIDAHMAEAAQAAHLAAAGALQVGSGRRETMQAAIDAVIGMDPLPPEQVLIAAVEQAFLRHRWQERAWRKQGTART